MGAAIFVAACGLPSADDAGAGAKPADLASADVPGKTGCARFADATFCADFDGPEPLSRALWSEVGSDDAIGGIAVREDDVVSVPRAARFRVATAPTTCEYMTAATRFATNPERLLARASVRATTPGTFVVVGSSVTSAENETVRYRLLVGLQGPQAGRVVLQRASKVVTQVAAVAFALDVDAYQAWTEVELDIDTRGASRTIAVTIAGATATLPLPDDYALVTPTLRIGPYCTARDADVAFDDVAAWAL